MATDTTVTINPAMEKAVNLLDQLAAELGVAASQIWEIMVAQASINVYTYLGSVIFAVICLVLGIKYGMKLANEEESPDKDVTQGMITKWIIIVVIAAIGFVISGLNVLCCFDTFVTCLKNPEYWAFKEIMRSLPR